MVGCFGVGLIVVGVAMIGGGLLFNLLVALVGGVLLIAGILVCNGGRKPEPIPPPAVAAPERRRACPHCAEHILAVAKVCRFCNRDVTPEPEPSRPLYQRYLPPPPPARDENAGTVVLVIVLLVGAILAGLWFGRDTPSTSTSPLARSQPTVTPFYEPTAPKRGEWSPARK